GNWGWNSEGEDYTQWTMDLVLRYAHAYRNVTGVDLVGTTNLGHFLPLYVAQTIYGDKPYMNTFGAGEQTAGLDLFAEGFSTVTEEYKSAVLWAWNYLLGLEDNKIERASNAVTAAFTLVNYPLEIEQKNPDQVLPHVIRDRQKGGYVFRNQWKDENDIVTQVYLKSEPHRAAWWYVGDGAFRIYGLGHPWVVKGAMDKYQASERTFENVVLLPDNINGWLGAQTTYFQEQENGSGIVSMNLNDTYLAHKQENGKKLPLADLYGRVLRQNTVDLGIRGMRSFAADYSGASGTPGLFVVVDKLTGGGQKVWQMIIPKEHQLSIAGRTFAIAASDGTTLKGTFVAPANVTLSPVEKKQFEHRNLRGELMSNAIALNGIQATGGDNFFVVMTLQTDSAPDVQSSGTGLDAKVKVGSQTISFTGDRIVLTKFPG
ncbi:MAG: hypothetical protein LDL41_20495, partial [Coleofasciculus sp. S288]|nr:hypothetical protein [Coleofasciculus sp. S288]